MKLRSRMNNLDKTSQNLISAGEPAIDSKVDKKQDRPSAEKASDDAQRPVKMLSGKNRFRNINSDLKSALDTWEVLTEQVTTKVSPQEAQLGEVKKLLQDLKQKLSEFGD